KGPLGEDDVPHHPSVEEVLFTTIRTESAGWALELQLQPAVTDTTFTTVGAAEPNSPTEQSRGARHAELLVFPGRPSGRAAISRTSFVYRRTRHLRSPPYAIGGASLAAVGSGSGPAHWFP